MNLQMSKALKQNTSYDSWKPYLYENGEKRKKFSSLLSYVDGKVSIQETSHEPEASKKKFKTYFFNNSKEGTSVNNNNSSFFNVDDDEQKSHICYLCKKKFQTKHALYGHMRCHPNRICKGTSPPSSNLSRENKNSFNSQSSILCMEHNKQEGFVAPKEYLRLPRWKKRDKRETKCSESYEAAMNLLHLSASNSNRICKGILPPRSNLFQENKNSSFSSQSSVSFMEHNKEEGFVAPKEYLRLPRWKKRDKREIKCSGSYEAAMNLMHLSASNSKYLPCSSVSIKKFDQPSFIESNRKKMELGESSSTGGKKQPIKRIRFVFSSTKLEEKNKAAPYNLKTLYKF